MYCPKCSQQQFSDEVRFCNRCGFQLKIVSELLATNGELPEIIAKKPVSTSLFQRRGTRIGAKIIFFSAVIFIPAFILGLIVDSPATLILPLLIFVIGILTMLYSRLFGSLDLLPAQPIQPTAFETIKPKLSLPVPESVPITNELKREEVYQPFQPPSVTEPTTKFLNDKQK